MHAQSARSWSLITHVHVRALHNPLRADSLSSCRWHPHRDAEIFSYVLDGELTHQDSMGNKESLARGGVQYLSAGTGVTHQEMNDGTERCRFIQVCDARARMVRERPGCLPGVLVQVISHTGAQICTVTCTLTTPLVCGVGAAMALCD